MAFPLEDSWDWEAVWTGCVVWSVHNSVADQPRLLGLSAVERRNSKKETIMIGEGINTQRIQRWMTPVLCGPGTPPGNLRLSLSHVTVDDAQRLLRAWELEGVPERNGFHELVDEIDHAASEDAAQLGGGTQRYLLRASTAGGRELGSLPLRYSVSSQALGEPGMLLDSEPSNARGLIALAMRHSEASARTLTGSIWTLMNSMERHINQQGALVERLMQFQIDKVELVDKLTGRQTEREAQAAVQKKDAEIELHESLAKIDRQQMWMRMGEEKLAPLIPALLNKLMGKDTIPGATSPRDEMLADILGTMTPEQFNGLKSILDPGQMANLLILIDHLQAARGAGKAEPTARGDRPQTERFTDETARLALERIKRELLPWVTERLKSGESLEPPLELAKVTRIFKLFVGALTRAQYDRLLGQKDDFNPEERTAFMKLAEAFNIVPAAETSGAGPMR
jgi:hypothetical protein